MYTLVFKTPRSFKERFQVTKQTAEAPNPKNNILNKTSGFLNLSIPIRKSKKKRAA